jgi:hypothetical protein
MKLLFCSAALLVSVTTAQAVTPNDPLPTPILTCGGSVITDTGTSSRSTTSVSYKNGLDTWSWETIQAVINSRKGDHVLICLVFIPEHCPEGDTRGKVYTTTNLRTLESWTVPDSEHSCGGA